VWGGVIGHTDGTFFLLAGKEGKIKFISLPDGGREITGIAQFKYISVGPAGCFIRPGGNDGTGVDSPFQDTDRVIHTNTGNFQLAFISGIVFLLAAVAVRKQEGGDY